MSKKHEAPIRERLQWAQEQGAAASEAIRESFDALRDASEQRVEGAEPLASVKWTRAEDELPSVHFAGGASATGDGPRGRTTRREPKETEERAHRIEVGVARGMLGKHELATAFCVFESLFAASRGKGSVAECKRHALTLWQVLAGMAQKPASARPSDLAQLPPPAESVLARAWNAASAVLRTGLGERGFAGVNPSKTKRHEGARYTLTLAGGNVRFPAKAVPEFLKQALLEADGDEASVPVSLTLTQGSHVLVLDGTMTRKGSDADAPKASEPSNGPVMTPDAGIVEAAKAA